ncbi:TP0733 family outer membrane beta-barrel protein [Treponema sp.]|uniref:TP0733 family outer membrane beta-barrel protein n=1 Tax=Treponema sp. TaxID=166 RepID=UPI003F06BC7A
MKRLITLFCVGIIGIYFSAAQASLPKTIFSQTAKEEDNTDDGDEYIEDDITFDLGMNLPGDQYIKLAIGVSVPINFPDIQSAIHGDGQLKIGGMGTIGYHYFLTSKVALGFDISFGFNVSIGNHVFNYVPFITSLTYQPVAGRFEFPLTLGIGFAWESFGGKNYFPGFVLKPEAGTMFRLTESWSLGAEASYLLMPQFSAWYNDDAENFAGQFLTLSVAARYHF